MSAPQQPGSSTTTIIQTAVNENTDKRDVGAFLKRQFQQSLAFGTLIVLIIFFSIASPNFFTFSNIATVLLSTAVIGILALGVVVMLVTVKQHPGFFRGETIRKDTPALVVPE